MRGISGFTYRVESGDPVWVCSVAEMMERAGVDTVHPELLELGRFKGSCVVPPTPLAIYPLSQDFAQHELPEHLRRIGYASANELDLFLLLEGGADLSEYNRILAMGQSFPALPGGGGETFAFFFTRENGERGFGLTEACELHAGEPLLVKPDGY